MSTEIATPVIAKVDAPRGMRKNGESFPVFMGFTRL
jgi:hypothetical protein